MTNSKTYIGCPQCVSFSNYTSKDEAETAVSDHNQRMHGEDGPATVIEPESEDSVNEFVDKAREVSPNNQYKELIKKITRGNTPFKVGTIDR